MRSPRGAVFSGEGIPPLVLYRGGARLTGLAVCRQLATVVLSRFIAPGNRRNFSWSDMLDFRSCRSFFRRQRSLQTQPALRETTRRWQLSITCSDACGQMARHVRRWRVVPARSMSSPRSSLTTIMRGPRPSGACLWRQAKMQACFAKARRQKPRERSWSVRRRRPTCVASKVCRPKVGTGFWTKTCVKSKT